MRERFGYDSALRLFLEPIISDRGRGVEPLRDVAGVKLDRSARVVSPDTRVTVGLQLHADRRLVGFGPRPARLRGFDSLEPAGKLLHVVTHLVGDHVGFSKIAGGVEARLQVAQECEIDVELLVVGTVEGTHAAWPMPHAECTCPS